MFPRAQFDAFRKANPKGGMTNLRYTFLLPSGVRTPMATGCARACGKRWRSSRRRSRCRGSRTQPPL